MSDVNPMSLGMNKKQQKVSAKDEPASSSKSSSVLQVKKIYETLQKSTFFFYGSPCSRQVPDAVVIYPQSILVHIG